MVVNQFGKLHRYTHLKKQAWFIFNILLYMNQGITTAGPRQEMHCAIKRAQSK